MSAKPTRIVIIGGGYTGIWAFKSIQRRLSRELKSGDVEVVVICPKSYHSFHGWTAESLTGIVSVANRQSPLRRIFRDQDVLRANAEKIDVDNQIVQIRYLSDGRTEEVAYDHVLIANGSYDNMESVPGLSDYGWTVKAQGGVMATRNQLLRIIERADALPAGEARDKAMTVVIAGGGFAGVEIAASVAEMYESFERFYPVLEEQKMRIVLVHSGAKLLPVLRPRYDKLADYCTKELRNYGVELMLNTRLQEVTAEGAVLSDEQVIRSDTVLCTVGQRATVFPGTDELPRSPRQLLLADQYLRVEGYDNIWSGGDAAEVPHIKGGICPANALWAIMHGKWAGDNIALTIQNKKLKPFNYRGLGQAASMGIGKGASELYTLQFTGWIGWFLRFFFFLYFQPSRRQAVRVFGDWMSLAFLGRYMSLSKEWRREDDRQRVTVT